MKTFDIEGKTSRLGGLLALFVLFAIVVFVSWAAWADIDQITRVPGKIIPSSRNQVVQVLDPGIVDEILVKEGALVKQGQLLMRFNRVKAEALYMETWSKVVALKAAVARLSAEVLGVEPRFPEEVLKYPEILANHHALFKKRRYALLEEIHVSKQALELVEAELAVTEPLLATGDVSKVDILKLKRQAVEIQGKITTRKNKYLEDAQAELAKAQESLEATQQVLAQHKQAMENAVIISPMDGVVRNIRLTTVGGVARAGEELMQIVPVEDDLLIEAKVKPTDIAYVKNGLPATVKLDAYDYTIYGTFPGVVTYISADTLSEEARAANEQPYYRVQVRMEGKHLSGRGPMPIEIQPGMTATVEIKTGSNTVLKYLAKPMIKTLNESLGER
ncbi:MAG: HlyD family type I secretion periplasmic adaptor subunit [Desulfobacteraceae bacterium]|nr:MAG: HlyD family type I secretion periplasmic adaptor subunit [Desulfobacteraceae bacterium]